MGDYLQRIERPSIRVLLVLPFILWILLYTTAPHFPDALKPTIDVKSLYYYDVALFRYLPSTELAKLQNVVFDILGAIAYTLHAAWPFVFLAYMVFFRRRDLILPYLNCFGAVCFLGLITQLVMPTAPPWYYYKDGFKQASYDMKGDPAGLARLDTRFNITFYQNMFLNSPVVFGSFPSLHVGWPTILAFFVFYETLLPFALRLAAVIYVGYVGLAVIYLQHHYMVDVLGGVLYAFLVYKLIGPKKKSRSGDGADDWWKKNCNV